MSGVAMMTSSSSILKVRRLQPGRVMVGPFEVPAAHAAAVRHSAGRPGRPSEEEALASDAEMEEPVFLAQAEEILQAARDGAEAILNEARVQAEENWGKAYDKGFEKGRAEGMASAKAEMLKDALRIGELARNAAVEMQAIFTSSEEALIGLALSIAEKVVHKRMEEDRSLVVSAVRGALEQVEAAKAIRVRVSPDDMQYLLPYWEEETKRAGGKSIDLTADPQVQVGGCIIDTASSVVDAQIETKLAEIDKAFRAELGLPQGA